MVVKRGPHFYNFWQDAEHPRGIWRRTTIDSYRKPEPEWDVLIDVDALNRTEGENWVWHGATFLRPKHRTSRTSGASCRSPAAAPTPTSRGSSTSSSERS